MNVDFSSEFESDADYEMNLTEINISVNENNDDYNDNDDDDDDDYNINDLAELFADNEHSSEYYIQQLKNFDETAYTKQNY